ncbi:phosphotransferase enzyme family protein [Alkalihalobacillus sp. R86527]|uniref:phosphotransferase enzyme family protein n=1 Tax=Alkalihalobacillus sp. R86527 TaxID=3093863 RepID=UPI00366F9780
MVEAIRKRLNERYPIDVTTVEAVTNAMYRCVAVEGTYYARITNYKTFDEQVEEVRYTEFLRHEGIGTSAAIASLNGNVVEKMSLPDKDVRTVLYEAAPGGHLPRSEWNADVLKEVGREIGRLHRTSKKFEETHPPQHINDWHDSGEYDFLTYIPEEERAIRTIAEEVHSTIRSIPKTDENYGLLHGDLWLENIVVDDDRNLTLIDFQDCEKHYYIFDLAVPIYSAIEYSFPGGGNIVDYGRKVTKAIIEGYEEENNLSPEMLEKLPLFIKLKELFEYSLMHRYWNKEKLTEEQMRIMNHFRMRLERNQSVLEEKWLTRT